MLDLHANGNGQGPDQGALLERRQTRASLGREHGPPPVLSGHVRKADDQAVHSPMNITQVAHLAPLPVVPQLERLLQHCQCAP